MELSAKYIYEVYRCKSVSAAARKLYVSQPALSSHIRKAEKELGFDVFDRSTNPFTLTPEGRIYIQSLEQIQKIENETANKIKDITELKSGSLIIGSDCHLACFLLPILIRNFTRERPDISFHIQIKTKSQLIPRFADNMINAYIGFDAPASNCKCIPMFRNSYVIAANKKILSENHMRYALTLKQLLNKDYGNKAITDFNIFNDLKFITPAPKSVIHNIMQDYFDEYQLSPDIAGSSNVIMMNYNLMRFGAGVLFTNELAAATMTPSADCRYFVLKNNVSRDLNLYYNPAVSTTTTEILNELAQFVREMYESSCTKEGILKLAKEYEII